MIRLKYFIDHQKGSHVVLKRKDGQRTIIIPDHNELDRGTLKAILKQSGFEIEELLSASYAIIGSIIFILIDGIIPKGR